jgi:hypothetical protein
MRHQGISLLHHCRSDAFYYRVCVQKAEQFIALLRDFYHMSFVILC